MMKLHEIKATLAVFPDATIRFILPAGEPVPAHAHVTEVAQITKRFIDCGGTLRDDVLCRLQTWVADDLEHRLTAPKLLAILNKASSTLHLTEDLDVDVEHEVQVISQFPLESVEPSGGELLFKLGERHTACLALDRCLPPPSSQSILFKPLPSFR